MKYNFLLKKKQKNKKRQHYVVKELYEYANCSGFCVYMIPESMVRISAVIPQITTAFFDHMFSVFSCLPLNI